jgi:hypothetical protein
MKNPINLFSPYFWIGAFSTWLCFVVHPVVGLITYFAIPLAIGAYVEINKK